MWGPTTGISGRNDFKPCLDELRRGQKTLDAMQWRWWRFPEAEEVARPERGESNLSADRPFQRPLGYRYPRSFSV
jgi:hypothetical protein